MLVKGADWGAGAVVGEPEVIAAGGEAVRVPPQGIEQGYSTSDGLNEVAV